MSTKLTKVAKGLVAAGLMAAASAYAASDVGLVRQLAGNVSYDSGSGSMQAKPYMKVRQGDRFSVAAGAQVQVIYFDSGRQESFAGPASFVAGAKQSAVQSGAQPQVKTLPTDVPERIAQTPELLQIAKLGRSGGVAVRGIGTDQRLTLQERSEVSKAQATYEQLRATVAADDIMPEQYLYAVLQDHLLYHDMMPVVQEMSRRQPGNQDVAIMMSYVQSKIASR